MNLMQLVKVIINLSLLALLASCAPKAADLGSYLGDVTLQSGIIGGSDADATYEKQHGIVGVYDTEQGGLCTGSLIGNGLVLTAGHCANVDHPEKMIIFFGPNFDDIIAQANNGDHSNLRRVVRAVRHEKYKEEKPDILSTNNDISLLRFQGDNVAGYLTVQLATAQQASALQKGTSVTLAGYGLSEYTFDPTSGKKLSSKGAGLLRMVDGVKIISVLATGEEITFDQSQGKGACHGDSGGPAYFVDANGATWLVGVTSRGGSQIDRCDGTSIYTGVIGYTDWIQTHLSNIMR